MIRAFYVFCFAAALFLIYADFKGLVASELLWSSRTEQKGEASGGFFHK